MAKQKNNVVTHGLSGKVGGMLVFRQTAGGTVVQSLPRASSNPVTEAQLAHRRKFQRAVLYANAVDSNPDLQTAYAAKAKPGQMARHVAVADFFHAPDISLIDLSDYHGAPDDTIRIETTDDLVVREVKVVIRNSDGAVVEEGYAVQGSPAFEWVYTAKSANATLQGDRIEVLASDTPGNIATKTVEL